MNDEFLLNILRSYFKKSKEADYYELEMISVDATITDYFDNGLLDEHGQISLAYENLKHIPRYIAERFGSQVKSLDLSYNNFSDFSFLTVFSELHTLVLDRNENPQESTFPFLPNLEILWMNNCNIKNISKWIYKIQRSCPKIRYLSLMGNPGARNLFTGATAAEENEYRNFVLSVLTTLIYLDDSAVPPSGTKSTTKSTKSKPLKNIERARKPKTILVRNLVRLRELHPSSSTN